MICAYIIVNRFARPSRPSDMLIQWMVTGMMTFYGLPVVIGEISGYINTLTLILSAALAMAGALYCRISFSPGPSDLRFLLSRIRQTHPVAVILAGIVCVLVLTTLWVGLVLPVRVWDASGYHVLNSVRWSQSGLFINDSFGNTAEQYYQRTQAINFPNLKAVLPFITMLWTGKTAGTALAQWPYLLLLIVASYGLYRRMGLTHVFSLIGVCICITAPEVILQSVEMYADLAFFAGTILTLWLCLKTWQDRFTMQDVILAACVFSLLASTKPNALPVCGVFGILYLVIVFFRNSDGARLSTRFGHVSLAFTAIVMFSLLVAGPWFIGGLRELGNPVYPIKIKIGEHVLFDGPYSPELNDGMVQRFTGRQGLEARWATLAEKWRQPSLSSWCGGLGAATFIIGVPCVLGWALLLVFSGKKNLQNGIPIVILGFGLLFATCPTPEVARFSMFLLALAALATGVVAKALFLFPRLVLGVATLGLCGYNVYCTVPSILFRPRSPELVAYSLFSGNPRAARRNQTPLQYDPIDYWLDKVAAPNTRLAISPDFPLWQTYDPAAKNDILEVYAKPDKTFEMWEQEVITHKCTHLLIARSFEHYNRVIHSPNFKLLSNRAISHYSQDPSMESPFNGSLFKVTAQ